MPLVSIWFRAARGCGERARCRAGEANANRRTRDRAVGHGPRPRRAPPKIMAIFWANMLILPTYCTSRFSVPIIGGKDREPFWVHAEPDPMDLRGARQEELLRIQRGRGGAVAAVTHDTRMAPRGNRSPLATPARSGGVENAITGEPGPSRRRAALGCLRYKERAANHGSGTREGAGI